MHIDIKVIEVTELNFMIKSDLRGLLEAAMAKITLQLLERLPSCFLEDWDPPKTRLKSSLLRYLDDGLGCSQAVGAPAHGVVLVFGVTAGEEAASAEGLRVLRIL